MKKTIKSLLAIAIAAFALSACSDVPEPAGYSIQPKGGTSGGDAGEATGNGTYSQPFNIAAVINKCKEVGQTASSESYYISGVVTEDAALSENDKKYGNITFKMGNTADATTVFTAYQVMGSKGAKLADDFTLKKGDNVVVYGPVVNFKGNTPETAGQGAAQIFSVNGKATDGSDPVPPGPSGEPQGDGTINNPFNVAAAIIKCKEAGETATTDKYYVKGIANGDYTVSSYKNIDIDLVDEGSSETFKVYHCKGNNGKDIPEGYQVKKGDVFIVYGPVVNYKGNTPETASGAFIVSINGNDPAGGSGEETADQAKGTGAVDNPFNVAGAVAKCKQIGTTPSTEEFYVKGVAAADATVTDATNKNITVDLVDNGYTQTFKAYRVLAVDGKKLKVGYKIAKGAEVIVRGKLVNYNETTPEISWTKDSYNGTLISVNGQAPEVDDGQGGGEGGGGQQGGEVSGNTITVAASSFGLDNATELSTLTLSDGTTLTFDAGGNKTTPKYYSAGSGSIRMYPNNQFTITSSKTIAAIEMVCDEYQGTLYNASGNFTVNDAAVTVDGKSLKFTGPNASSAVVKNAAEGSGAATQARIVTLIITYAN